MAIGKNAKKFYAEKELEIKETIEKLITLGFTKVKDEGSKLSTGDDLYFKKIKDYTYLIFSHYCVDRNIQLQGIDCWKCTFISPKHIGKKHPLSDEIVRFSFHWDFDYDLIKEYL